MSKVIFRGEILIFTVVVVFLLGLLFSVSCNDLTDEGFLEPSELSKDAESLAGIMGIPKEWIFRYHAVEETQITLRGDYYENGKQTISYAPTFSGKIEGEGLLLLDYKDGELLIGIADNGGHQSIQSTFGDPENTGSVKHSMEERVTLDVGTYPIAAIIMSMDGSIKNRGIADQEAIDFNIKNNDFVVVFTLEVH